MKLAILAILLFAAAAAEFWALKNRAQVLCLSAHSLAEHAPRVAGWVEEANADPFLGPAALQGMQNVLDLYRLRSREISTELSSRFLSPRVREAFFALALAAEGSPDFAQSLRALPYAADGLRCDAGAAEPNLAVKMEDASRYWRERGAQLVVDKTEFSRDKNIYCRSEQLLRGLHRLLEVAGKLCESSASGSKLKQACDRGKRTEGFSVTGKIEAEISDLQKQKEFNMRKLQQKWPARVLKELSC